MLVFATCRVLNFSPACTANSIVRCLVIALAQNSTPGEGLTWNRALLLLVLTWKFCEFQVPISLPTVAVNLLFKGGTFQIFLHHWPEKPSRHETSDISPQLCKFLSQIGVLSLLLVGPQSFSLQRSLDGFLDRSISLTFYSYRSYRYVFLLDFASSADLR